MSSAMIWTMSALALCRKIGCELNPHSLSPFSSKVEAGDLERESEDFLEQLDKLKRLP
jgi:hypothetical protein